jgi:hypothetical protein
MQHLTMYRPVVFVGEDKITTETLIVKRTANYGQEPEEGFFTNCQSYSDLDLEMRSVTIRLSNYVNKDLYLTV